MLLSAEVIRGHYLTHFQLSLQTCQQPNMVINLSI
jgi:hypothetical protein